MISFVCGVLLFVIGGVIDDSALSMGGLVLVALSAAVDEIKKEIRKGR